jgi:catechol 2,3-dioxygenase-like lactoylglutathione lyase family enzyme
MIPFIVRAVAVLSITACATADVTPHGIPHGAKGGDMTTQTDMTRAAVVRYQVADIERSIAFYTARLDFALEQRAGSAFASVTRGNLRLILSGPGSSGARPMPDGTRQEPGGWNRIVLYVTDLEGKVAELEKGGVRARNRIERGPGGSQIQIEDPDGNPIELHEEP